MLHAPLGGALELRRTSAGATIIGRFPYQTPTELVSRRYEQFEARAFASRLVDDEADVHLLVAHDFDKPIASRKAGTLTMRDSDDALTFEARISSAIAETSHGRDVLALIAEGLSVGLSPDFQVREGGETVERRANGTVLRTVREADLHELSIVTRPAYPTAQVEARSWEPSPSARSLHPYRQWVF